MAYDLEEQESLEELKAWWSKWGTPIMAAVTLVCLIFAGFNGYKWYQKREAQNAAVAYQAFQNAIYTNAKTEEIVEISNQIKKEFTSTVYASLTGLQIARYYSSQNEKQKAADELLWVLNTGKRPEFDTLSRMRLATVYLDLGQAEKAKEVLEAAKPSVGEKGYVEDRLGDVWYTLGEMDKARSAWQAAAGSDIDRALQSFVSLKLESLSQKQ